MRLDHRNVKRQFASSAAALAAAALLALAAPAQAQSFDAGAQVASAAANVMADVIPATRGSTFGDAKPISATFELGAAPADNLGADSGPLAADPSPAADDSVVAGIGALDDQTLSHQRGGAVGMLMVAATPQLMHGANSVTLWDEIAPPAPLPIPVDSSQAAQGNVASYTRR
jgi:hypothetical protein